MRSFPAYSRRGVWLGCSLSDRVVSSQGVTLTDLQEAERTFSRSRVERQAQEQPSLKPGGPTALGGGPRKLEPLAAPAQDAGESHQPWVRSPEREVSNCRVRAGSRGRPGGLLFTGSPCLLLCSGPLPGSLCTSVCGWQACVTERIQRTLVLK